jgi:hypothetical protein
VFSSAQRDVIRAEILALAAADPAIAAAAEVGSFAAGIGDRWSDLDLTFAVGQASTVEAVLTSWTQKLQERSGALVLFDLPSRATIYRVFLFSGGLQVDLSFTPEAEFRPRGPAFHLLFGAAGPMIAGQPPSARYLFGVALHHAVRVRVSMERRRYWQAEYWISETRSLALGIAALRAGLNAREGRSFDDLPPNVLEGFRGAFAHSVEPAELWRAFEVVVAGLIGMSDAGEADGPALAAQLRSLLDRGSDEAPRAGQRRVRLL